MGAQILQLVSGRSVRLARAATPSASFCSAATAKQLEIEQVTAWSGASGKSYVHTIYDLFDCPELPACNYMLVGRDANGRRHILRIEQTTHKAASENLAYIRQTAATLGADEIHVHLLPDTDKARALIELDLRAGQFGSLTAAPTAATGQ